MATATEPLKKEETDSAEVMIGGCSEKSLGNVVRELWYSFDERQRGGPPPRVVHIYCSGCREEGEYITRAISKRLEGKSEVTLLLGDASPRDPEFQIDLRDFIRWAKDPRSPLNRGY